MGWGGLSCRAGLVMPCVPALAQVGALLKRPRVGDRRLGKGSLPNKILFNKAEIGSWPRYGGAALPVLYIDDTLFGGEAGAFFLLCYCL
jgi:hypothetical protein